jgi:hypothetical protein
MPSELHESNTCKLRITHLKCSGLEVFQTSRFIIFGNTCIDFTGWASLIWKPEIQNAPKLYEYSKSYRFWTFRLRMLNLKFQYFYILIYCLNFRIFLVANVSHFKETFLRSWEISYMSLWILFLLLNLRQNVIFFIEKVLVVDTD